MKDVQINKFRVIYEGVAYGPGQEAGSVIVDLPDEIADPLIAGSMGRIIDITRHEAPVPKGKKKKDAPAESDEVPALPGVDPGKTVNSK